MRICAFLLLSHTACLFAQATDEQPPPVLTVCDALKDIQRYDGKVVIIVARLSSTMEGQWLDAECGFKVKNGGQEFSTSITTSSVRSDLDPVPQKPSGFQWDEPLLRRKLLEIMGTTKLRAVENTDYADRWMAVYGRLITHLPYRIHFVDQRSGKEGELWTRGGFGHLGASPAMLIPPADGFFTLQAR
jgi:hypothetical protein